MVIFRAMHILILILKEDYQSSIELGIDLLAYSFWKRGLTSSFGFNCKEEWFAALDFGDF